MALPQPSLSARLLNHAERLGLTSALHGCGFALNFDQSPGLNTAIL
jgi:hypothetical protein